MKKIVKSFEYYINVAHYGLYYSVLNNRRVLQQINEAIILLLLNLIPSKNLRVQLLRKIIRSRDDIAYILFDSQYSIHSNSVKRIFDRITSLYYSFPIGVLMGIYEKIKHIPIWYKIYPWIWLIGSIASAILISHIIERLVYYNEKWLLYNEEFKHRNKAWHRKAMLLLTIYVLGGIVSCLAAVFTMILIIEI